MPHVTHARIKERIEESSTNEPNLTVAQYFRFKTYVRRSTGCPKQPFYREKRFALRPFRYLGIDLAISQTHKWMMIWAQATPYDVLISS